MFILILTNRLKRFYCFNKLFINDLIQFYVINYDVKIITSYNGRTTIMPVDILLLSK
jgi:hypothetical protein